MSRQVLPQAPSPTITSLRLISAICIDLMVSFAVLVGFVDSSMRIQSWCCFDEERKKEREKERKKETWMFVCWERLRVLLVRYDLIPDGRPLNSPHI